MNRKDYKPKKGWKKIVYLSKLKKAREIKYAHFQLSFQIKYAHFQLSFQKFLECFLQILEQLVLILLNNETWQLVNLFLMILSMGFILFT